jgi:hypothetical protein
MTAVTSLGIRTLVLEDKMGEVHPNVWYAYIAPSGTGEKTPPLVRIRKLIANYWKPLIAPAKFTPQFFTEWVMGSEGKSTSDGKVTRKPIPSHPHSIILRDEGSGLLGETKWTPNLATMLEYLSCLYDCYIEGYGTRQFQYEGNIPVFVSFVLFSSLYFYDLLDKAFFAQGTGNRILWNPEKISPPEDINAQTFFFGKGEKDLEWEKFESEVIESLKELEDIGEVYIEKDSRELWANFRKKCATLAYEEGVKNPKSAFASYIYKQPLNALKLSMNYAASVHSIDNNKILWILSEDMNRAIDDVKEYIENWKVSLQEWEEWVTESAMTKQTKPLEIRKYEIRKFIRFALGFPDKLVCSREISEELGCPDRTKIGEILSLAVNKGLLEIFAEVNDKTVNLNEEQIKRFKSGGGPTPCIYRVTEEGERYVERL